MFTKLLLSHIYLCTYEIPDSYINMWYLWRFFIAELQATPSQLISVLSTTSFYQVQTILILLATVNCEGENSGLKVIFHLKDENGHISNPYLTLLDPNTKLVYANVSTTPLIHLSPLKEKNSPDQENTLPPGWKLLYY